MMISFLLAFLLLMSWAMIAMLFGLTRVGRPWRGRARLLAAWAGIVLALGVFILEPHLFPDSFLLQWLVISSAAMLAGEGGMFILSWMVTRVLRRLEEQTERRKIQG